MFLNLLFFFFSFKFYVKHFVLVQINSPSQFNEWPMAAVTFQVSDRRGGGAGLGPLKCPQSRTGSRRSRNRADRINLRPGESGFWAFSFAYWLERKKKKDMHQTERDRLAFGNKK